MFTERERPDYYKMLGLPGGASVSEVKTAYRKLAKQYHADSSNVKERLAKCKTEQEQEQLRSEMNASFSQISTAHSILTDEEKKRRYDNGEDVEENEMNGGGAGMSDIFEFFTGGLGGRNRGPRKARSRQETITVSLLEVLKGKKCKYKVPRRAMCMGCSGFGAQGAETCRKCRGEGSYMKQRRMGHTIMATEVACDGCRGNGHVKNGPTCAECKGSCYKVESRIMEFTLPRGVYEGYRQEFAGMGDEERGAQPGDLIFSVHIAPHPEFKIAANSGLYVEKKVPIHKILLGEDIALTTVDERVLSISLQGLRTMNEFVIVKGEGVPHPKYPSRQGDLYIKLIVDLPDKTKIDSKRLKEVLGVAASESSQGGTKITPEFVDQEMLEKILSRQSPEEEGENGHEGGRQRQQCATM